MRWKRGKGGNRGGPAAASGATDVDDVVGGRGGGIPIPGGLAGLGAIPRSEDPDADLKDFSVYVFQDVQNTWQKTFVAATSKRASEQPGR